MEYLSPFHSIDVEHDGCDPLCLSLEHDPDPAERTWGSFFETALALLEDGAEQPAFYLARHFVELSLKRLQPPTRGHNLTMLLDQLPGDEPLASATDGSEYVLRCFIEDLAHVDPDSTAGRYGITNGGPAFRGTCCVNRKQLLYLLRELFNYVARRTEERREAVGA